MRQVRAADLLASPQEWALRSLPQEQPLASPCCALTGDGARDGQEKRDREGTMDTQHTPGEWKLLAGRCISTASGSFSIHSNDDWNRNWVELDANARLIAQAPALLKALKVTTGTLEALFKGDDLGHARNVVELAMLKGHAAIEAAS